MGIKIRYSGTDYLLSYTVFVMIVKNSGRDWVMKKIFIRMSSILMAVAMSTVFSLTAYASTEAEYKVVSYLQKENRKGYDFDDEKVDELQEDAEAEPIRSDKTNSSISIMRSSSGTYPTRSGVILVTADKYKGLIPTGHAAIIWSSKTVVESLSNGVTTGKNDWNTTKSTCYGVAVSGTTAVQDSAAANWAYKQIGKPYNWNYLDKWTRSKFYCSQLIYAAYKDLYNIDLDTSAFGSAIHPLELVSSSKTYTIYQK